MMDHLARRDHSERELRQKLKGKFEPDEIEHALDYGKEKGWIPEDEESKLRLARKMAEFLHRKLKGIHYINQYLSEKGLPSVETDGERELEKARELLENKFAQADWRDRQMQAKAGRFLVSRGFEMGVVREILFNRSKG